MTKSGSGRRLGRRDFLDYSGCCWHSQPFLDYSRCCWHSQPGRRAERGNPCSCVDFVYFNCKYVVAVQRWLDAALPTRPNGCRPHGATLSAQPLHK